MTFIFSKFRTMIWLLWPLGLIHRLVLSPTAISVGSEAVAWHCKLCRHKLAQPVYYASLDHLLV